jgi:hypothetical protein
MLCGVKSNSIAEHIKNAKTMYKRVIFSFEVASNFFELDVYANNDRIKVKDGKGEFDDYYSTGILSIWFIFSGSNGTAYTIKYNCTVGGIDSEDSKKPSPHKGKIIKNGYKEEKIEISIRI